MNVGLDITSLLYQRGVSRYTSNLVYALLEQPGVTLSLFGYSLRQHAWLKAQAEHLLRQQREKPIVIKPYPVNLMSWLWRFGHSSIKSVLPQVEVFHSWDWLQPPDTAIPIVSTVHDLAIMKFPKLAHSTILAHHQKSLAQLAQRQTHIIAVSQTTKKDLVELVGYAPYLIHVIHEALPLEVRAVSEALTEEKYQEIVIRLQLTRPFVLFVGTREPRKNLERLVQAWLPLAKDVDLLLVGDKGWDETSTKPELYNHPNLRFMGRVSDRELSVLYSEAQIFAFVSLYEGFGLPILEAFHHGTPVVTANTSGMREVAGNAAELVDPSSVENIREGLVTILNEDLPSQRKRLQRMIIRQQMFDWRKVAEQTMTVYSQAIEDFYDKKT